MKKEKKVQKPRFRKTKITLLVILLIIFIPILSFKVGCSFVKSPSDLGLTTEISSAANDIEGYLRSEESTYLTLPEWYTVFSYQEYAEFLINNKPSSFPYFSAVNQYWYSYCQADKITKENYPFNFGNHLMLFVIGTSFSAEYWIKGIYENTIGRITEFDSYKTDEDLYATQVALEYGQFIPDLPWYEFPFGKKLIGAWTEPKLIDRNLLRKYERKGILSVQFSIETLYGGIIKIATHAYYGAPDDTDYLTVENLNESLFAQEERMHKIKELGNSSYIISLPHYQGFTEIVPWLALSGVDFLDISGNDEIVMTLIAPNGWTYVSNEGYIIYNLNIPSKKELKRVAVKVPVASLSDEIRNLDNQNIEVEHLYDY